MLGDSFCKLHPLHDHVCHPAAFNPHAWGLFLQVYEYYNYTRASTKAFNPHAWGLFLQAHVSCTFSSSRTGLSIPMLGDSFCKLRTS